SLAQAFERFEALEFAAKTLIKGRQLGVVRYLSEEQLALAEQRKVDWPDFAPPPATAREKELRLQLSTFVRRGCRQRLLISTEGSFSLRLDQQSFLITPSQQDRMSLGIDDFVLVREGRIEAEKRPSRATLAHQAIYQRHPDVGAIVFAHPVNATAFSVTDSKLDARTIPESYLFLRDIRTVPFGVQFQASGEIADYVSPQAPAAMLENDGVLVLGTDALDAFDRLEVLESTAEAVINACALGEVAPMPGHVIADLKREFGLK
ncbi:MAG: class II aldolase/adducin family protein, partial [Pirellulales bacterium]|nr:class II aldolase/adducin family protein [Pirellulales bacterium]